MSNIPDNNQPDFGNPPDLNHDQALQIDIIVDEDLPWAIDPTGLQRAARQAAAYRHYDRGEICIRVTGDNIIHQINKEHLGHDYPTDVISFAYRDQRPLIQGEMVVSAETANQRAAELGWPAASELLLYVVHGMLHLTGMDDIEPAQRSLMRQAEAEIMISLGLRDITRFAADVAASTVEDRA